MYDRFDFHLFQVHVSVVQVGKANAVKPPALKARSVSIVLNIANAKMEDSVDPTMDIVDVHLVGPAHGVTRVSDLYIHY